MHLAIVSTTIHDESGYLPFDRLAADGPFDRVDFVISGDRKSAPFSVKPFRCPVEYLDVSAQGRYQCSEAIGWNKIMRRNTALLRAIEVNPDFILTIDDDNHPASDYFVRWHQVLTRPATRVLVPSDSATGPTWHNYLATSDAAIPIYARGFPIVFRSPSESVRELRREIAPEKIGVFQGISVGDPDIDAMTRIVYQNKIEHVRDTNYCLQDVWSPYNTQNTVFARTVFPLAFVWPYCGRYDDIYSSFVWQRFLFNSRMYIHVGDAVNRQDRGVRNILRDFENEVEGYLHAHDVWAAINSIEEADSLAFLTRLLAIDHPIIRRHHEFFKTYMADLASVTGC